MTWIEELVIPDVCPRCGDWSRLFEVHADGRFVALGCEVCLREAGYDV